MKRTLLIAVVVAALGSYAQPARADEDKGESREARVMKGRMHAPNDADIDTNATVAALLARGGKDDWSEKKGARLEGYVIQVEKEEDGDMHFVIAGAASESDTHQWVITEVPTAWRKKGGKGMEGDALRNMVGKHVRLTGWLFYEPDTDSPDPRGTLWELHPVTKVEVLN